MGYGAHLLALAILRHIQGCVVGQLFDRIRQLASHARLGALVCFIPGVTGIDLHGYEAQLPAVTVRTGGMPS